MIAGHGLSNLINWLCERRAGGGVEIDFYREDDGSLPVRTWLDGLPEDVRGKVIARIDLKADRLSITLTLRKSKAASANYD